jgi:hypothetical protein
MRIIILTIILFLGIFSCEEPVEKVDKEKERKESLKKKMIDSLYVDLGKNNNSRTNWEDFGYDYLYELQEYLEGEDIRLTIKNIYDYEIYKEDTTYIFSFALNEFSNTIYFDVTLPRKLLDTLIKQDRANYNIHELYVIELDELKPILFEYEAVDDDYYSKIEINRNTSLKGKGTIIDIDYYKEEKELREKIHN